MINLYKILDIDDYSDIETIKKSYRKKSLVIHPDKNIDTNSTENFIELNQAYEILSNINKKTIYDSELRNYELINNKFTNILDFKNLVNITTKDIRTSIEISLKDAIFGAKKNIIIERTEICNNCYGKKCIKCENGFFVFNETIEIDIPKVVKNMSVIKIEEKGNIVFNNKNKILGDLYITISFPQYEDNFSISDKDLTLWIEVPFYYVLLEKTIDINIFNEKNYKLKLNSTNGSGHIYSIDNDLGLNILVKVDVSYVPNKISEENINKLSDILKDIYGRSI